MIFILEAGETALFLVFIYQWSNLLPCDMVSSTGRSVMLELFQEQNTILEVPFRVLFSALRVNAFGTSEAEVFRK